MGIQILQYEFMGPVPIGQWGPPMEKTIYIILGHVKDRFHMLYAGQCEHTDEKAFLVQHDSFKCWVSNSGSEKALHIAILPLFEHDATYRKMVLGRILARCEPPCNPRPKADAPSYAVRRAETVEEPGAGSCPACGSMTVPHDSGFRCISCGLTRSGP